MAVWTGARVAAYAAADGIVAPVEHQGRPARTLNCESVRIPIRRQV
jgi:hypothetical protein